MIVDERLVTYINSLDTGNTALLDQIEKEATEQYGSGNRSRVFRTFDGGI